MPALAYAFYAIHSTSPYTLPHLAFSSAQPLFKIKMPPTKKRAMEVNQWYNEQDKQNSEAATTSTILQKANKQQTDVQALLFSSQGHVLQQQAQSPKDRRCR